MALYPACCARDPVPSRIHLGWGASCFSDRNDVMMKALLLRTYFKPIVSFVLLFWRQKP